MLTFKEVKSYDNKNLVIFLIKSDSKSMIHSVLRKLIKNWFGEDRSMISKLKVYNGKEIIQIRSFNEQSLGSVFDVVLLLKAFKAFST